MKKYPQKIYLKTLENILDYCNLNGAQRRTNLATGCNMSYTRFIPYLNLLEYFGMLKILKKEGEFILITESGKSALKKLQDLDHMINDQ